MIRRCAVQVSVLLAGLCLLVGCSSASGSSGSSSGGGSAPAAASGSDLQGNTGTGTFRGAAVDPPLPRPRFTLTGTDGKPYAFGTATAKAPTLLYFGYTNCPDICPETMANVRVALAAMKPAVAAKYHVVFVTTDVKHDTAKVLNTWLGNFSAGSKGTWTALRGTQAEVNAAQAAAHITLAEDGGQTHSAQLLLYGPDDYAHVTFLDSSTQRQQLEHDLPLVAAGRR